MNPHKQIYKQTLYRPISQSNIQPSLNNSANRNFKFVVTIFLMTHEFLDSMFGKVSIHVNFINDKPNI